MPGTLTQPAGFAPLQQRKSSSLCTRDNDDDDYGAQCTIHKSASHLREVKQEGCRRNCHCVAASCLACLVDDSASLLAFIYTTM